MKAPLLIFSFLLSSPLFAHADPSAQDAFGWYAVIALNLACACLAYFRGFRLKGKGEFRAPLLFVAGIFAIILSLFPPIDRISEELLSIHMIQHMLLMMVSAPLFVFSYSEFFIKLGLPRKLRRQIWAISRTMSASGLTSLSRPLAVALLYALVLWIWHLPFLYQAALGQRWIHSIQHLAFFVASYFFWKVLLRRIGRPALNPGAGILYLFVSCLHSTALGALMALSPQIFYPFYKQTTMVYGLTAIEDQQLAGYIMWMPAGTSYVIVAVILTLRLLREPADLQATCLLPSGEHSGCKEDEPPG